MGEQDERISLLGRLIEHARNTARCNVFYGDGPRHLRRARAAPRTSRSSTSTTVATAARARSRATRRSAPGPAAWPGRCSGFAEQLEFLATLPDEELAAVGGRAAVDRDAARGGPRHLRLLPGQHADRRHPVLGHRRAGPGRELGDYLDRPADPVQPPRAGRLLRRRDRRAGPAAAGPLPAPRRRAGQRYWQAGLTVARTLFGEPYLSTERSIRA